MEFDYYVKYFSMLEQRLLNIEKYVAFESDNLKVYSIEFASIINDCCGLINSFCYDLCCRAEPGKKRFEIKDYKKYITENFQKDELIWCGEFKIQPWESLMENSYKNRDSNPSWWDDYNSIKHSGKSSFKKANLKTAISCMAGMFFLLLMFDYRRLGNTMCNWRGFFSDAGNRNCNKSWHC